MNSLFTASEVDIGESEWLETRSGYDRRLIHGLVELRGQKAPQYALTLSTDEVGKRRFWGSTAQYVQRIFPTYTIEEYA